MNNDIVRSLTLETHSDFTLTFKIYSLYNF